MPRDAAMVAIAITVTAMAAIDAMPNTFRADDFITNSSLEAGVSTDALFSDAQLPHHPLQCPR
ncbi:MAG: hypothetical protein ACREQI_01570 [Candidatus Binataceae bacterium]